MERRSRPRSRNIDRETVLRINRRPRHRSADYIWPPRQITQSTRPFYAPPRTFGATNQKLSHHQQKQQATTSSKKVRLPADNDDGKMSSSCGNKISNSTDSISHIGAEEAVVAETSTVTVTTTSRNEMNECLRRSGSLSPCGGSVHLWPPAPPPLVQSPGEVRKGFYLPQEKLHSGEIDEIKRHFEGTHV